MEGLLRLKKFNAQKPSLIEKTREPRLGFKESDKTASASAGLEVTNKRDILKGHWILTLMIGGKWRWPKNTVKQKK